MPRAALPLKLAVRQTTLGRSWDLQLACVRPAVGFRHSPSPPDDAVVLAFTSVPALTPGRNLRLRPDFSNPFFFLPDKGTEGHTTSATFLLHTRDFLLTDVFASTAEGTAVPLYWKHPLPLDAAAGSPAEVYDKDFKPVTEHPWLHWRTDVENAVFNNLCNQYDPETGVLQVFYVSYLDKDGVRRVELLDNVPAFALLTVEEYDQLSPAKRFYSLEDRGSHYLVHCLFDYKRYSPTPRGLSYLVPKASYGQAQAPLQTDMSFPWAARVEQCSFYHVGRDGVSRHYSLPEFDCQDFSPYYPYRFAGQVPGTVLAPRMIKALHGHLKVDPDEGFHLECIVLKPNGDVRYALSTDPDKVLYADPQGNLTGVRYLKDGFASVSRRDGFIHLNVDVGLSDDVRLTYNYREQSYSYPWLNLNPLFNVDLIGQEAVLYLVPRPRFSRLVNICCADGEPTATAAVAREAFGASRLLDTYNRLEDKYWHTADVLILDVAGGLDPAAVAAALEAGKLVLTTGSQYAALKTALGITAEDSQVSEGNVSLVYVRCRQGLLVNAEVGETGGLEAGYQALDAADRQSLGVVWGRLADLQADAVARLPAPDQSLFHLLLDSDRTVVESSHPSLPLAGKTFAQFVDWFTTGGVNCNQFIILGQFQVVTGGLQPNQVQTVDCRQRGGGFKVADDLPRLLVSYPELNWCLDQARLDGHPFAGAAAVLVELPHTVLTEYGGRFSHQEVLDKVKKYLGTGIYPVVRYYGSRDPRITSVVSQGDRLLLAWEDVGGPYTVYWSHVPGVFIHKEVVEASSFTITGLKAGLSYTVLVTPILDNSRMLGQEPLVVDFDGLQTVLAAGLESAAAVGDCNVVYILRSAALTSQESLGTARLKQILHLPGLSSQETLGTANLVYILRSAGIASQEIHGDAGLVQLVRPAGIASQWSPGQAKLVQILRPSGLSSQESLGNPTVA